MANEIIAISDGFYTLAETKNEKQFCFFRNDGNVLANVNREPLELYQAYVMHKMMQNKNIKMVASNIHKEVSEDGRYMKITIYSVGEKNPENKRHLKRKNSFLKKWLNRRKE